MIGEIGSQIKNLFLEPVIEKSRAQQIISDQKTSNRADQPFNSIGRSTIMAELAGLGSPLQVFNGVVSFERAPVPKPRPSSVIQPDPFTKIYGEPITPAPAKESSSTNEAVETTETKEALDRAFGEAETPVTTNVEPTVGNNTESASVSFGAAIQVYESVIQFNPSALGSQVNLSE